MQTNQFERSNMVVRTLQSRIKSKFRNYIQSIKNAVKAQSLLMHICMHIYVALILLQFWLATDSFDILIAHRAGVY